MNNAPSITLMFMVKFTIPAAAQMKNTPLLQLAMCHGRGPDFLLSLSGPGGASQTMRIPVFSIFKLEIMMTAWTPTKKKNKKQKNTVFS